jgi:thioredoxin reductase
MVWLLAASSQQPVTVCLYFLCLTIALPAFLVTVENFPGFPTGVLGPELMDKFREQSVRFGTRIITETVSKIDLSARPFRYWREMQEDGEPETADTIIIATGASAKRLGLKGEETYWQSGISACAVCDGAVPIFRYVVLSASSTERF